MNKREKKKIKKQIVELLEKTPIVLSVCSRVNIARSTFYRWKEEDPIFSHSVNEAMESGRSTINDLAINQLIMNIKNGNMTAIIFWLKHNHNDFDYRRYKIPKIEEEITLTKAEIAEMDEFIRNNYMSKENIAIEAEIATRLDET